MSEDAHCSYRGCDGGAFAFDSTGNVVCESCFETITTCSQWKCDQRLPLGTSLCHKHQVPDIPVGRQDLRCPECLTVGDLGTIHYDLWFCNACDEVLNPYQAGYEQLERAYA